MTKLQIVLNSNYIRPAFWSKDSYNSYEDAKQNGAVYLGESCGGYTSFMDMISNVKHAVNCISYNAHKNSLVLRLFAGDNCIQNCQTDYGDFTIEQIENSKKI